jgi:flagellar basal-body rod protein FlgB
MKGAVSVLDDVTSAALHTALSGLAKRQRVIADNLANVETPGFLAGKVSFESALASAVRSGDPSSVTPSVARSLEPTRLNGNNVNLDEETLSNVDTGLKYQLVLRALDAKYGLLHDAIKGGA